MVIFSSEPDDWECHVVVKSRQSQEGKLNEIKQYFPVIEHCCLLYSLMG